MEASNLHSYHSNFYNYMVSNYNEKLTETGKSEKWVMPYVSPGCPVCLGKGNILFAGEAAGFLNPWLRKRTVNSPDIFNRQKRGHTQFTGGI
jgi:hypothetical protein